MIIVWKTDNWHTHASKVLHGVFDEKKEAIVALAGKYKLTAHNRLLLHDINQTQSSEGDEYEGEFVLEEVPLNILL